MKNLMTRFLTSIGLADLDRYDLTFEVVNRNPFKKEQLDMVILKETPWQYDLLADFLNAIRHIGYPATFAFHYKQKAGVKDAELLFSQWYQATYRIPLEIELDTEGGTLRFHYDDETERQNFEQTIAEFRYLLDFISYEIPIEHFVAPPIVVIDQKKVARLNRQAEKVIDLEPDNPIMDNGEIHDTRRPIAEAIICSDLEENIRQMEAERRDKRLFKKGDYQPVAIGDFDENTGNIDFDGILFNMQSRDLQSKKTLFTFNVGSGSHGISVKAISDERHPLADKLSALEDGCRVRVRGATTIDRYTNELTVMVHQVDPLPELPLRNDESARKRVELHLHTKMSAMDGIGDIGEYCRLAKHMGHTAIAVTDHGVLQAYPDAQKAAAKYGLKMIYGAELYMFDAPKYIENPSKAPLDTSAYVAFDLETTGLSVADDHIIEFGAVRIQKGIVVQTLDILINPGPDVKLTAKIQELTNITPNMLKGKPTLSEVLPEIIKFIGADILVSHNAEFDIGFMNEALKRRGMAPLANPTIDTLALSRNVFSEASTHKLGSLAHKLDVVYEEGKAHRADYDAQVLGQIWVSLVNILTNKYKMTSHEDIASLPLPPTMLKNLFPYHVVVLTKDRHGLKDLFKLITLSHTTTFADVPLVPRHELGKARAHLLVGSACHNGELFDLASRRTLEELDAAIAFYDYVEIQPLANYSFLINMDYIDGEERLKTILTRMIEGAKKQGKPVVATSDCHYVNPEDKLYRDVYVYAKGLRGVNHPLMPYQREQRPEFENPDQHFRSTSEMLAEMAWLGADAEAFVIDNTNAIAALIEPVNPIKDRLYTPRIDGSEDYIKDICHARAKAIYGDPLPPLVAERLEAELSGIIKNGYSVIYYIAHKIIKKAREDGYIVGSRGSVGSSFVATMAAITEVNPLPPHYVCPNCQYSDFGPFKDVRSGFDLEDRLCPQCLTPLKGDGQNIPFATFLGFEAEKVPDIDLNFPPDYQARAHDYARELLGSENVYRAGTIETVADKMAFGYVRGYFERRHFDLEKVPRQDIAYIAWCCRGVKRTTGQHPGGLVVIPTGFEVHDFTPLQYPADRTEGNAMTTHLDFHALHDNVLKLDLLGHVDPLALKMMSEMTGVAPDDVPLNDRKVLSLFSSEEALGRKIKNIRSIPNGALGIPEFGTSFVMGLLESTNPKTFGELVIVSGLSHGTNVWRGNAEQLILDGTTDLSGVIGCRDDIMTYLIDHKVPAKTAFAIMEDVRKGRKVKPAFAEVMKACHVPEYYIESCNKIKYMFPKAHAAAYVTMAVRVAWFKVYHPLEYYAAFFSLRSKQFELATMIQKPSEIFMKIENRRIEQARGKRMTPKEEEIQYTLRVALEMAERGFSIGNIDLDRSDAELFLIDKEKLAIIPPFIVVDGIGQNAATSVVAARSERAFMSRSDLLERTKLSATNLEDLAKLGVLDHLDESNQLSLFSFDNN